MLNEVKKIDFDSVALIKTKDIRFEPSLIELCEKNSCGNYNTNWTCPPLVGDTPELVKKIKQYENAVIFQKIYHLEDSFDYEGMTAGQQNFRELCENLHTECKNESGDFLLLSAGGCRLCDRCAALDNLPCVNPEAAFSSLEAYGIQVSTLAELCGMKYINGANTVTYFGGVFFESRGNNL